MKARVSETASHRVVRLTPPGRGAVATLLVEGPSAAKVVGARFRPYGSRPQPPCGMILPGITQGYLESHPHDQLLVGHFDLGLGDPAAGEEVVVRRRSDQAVELHCHGGETAVAMIENGLAELGCRTVAWRDWIAEHHEDPIAAAARVALAEARTARTAAILLDQFHGALRRAMESIDRARRAGDTKSAGDQIDALLARADLGLHLVRPWRVVLAGRPNVGKSSLINAMVGYPRAIVHPVSGTTRDVVTAGTAVDGWPVELADTAGLHTGEDALEQEGVRLARQRLADADLVILVFDAGAPWSESDQALAARWPEALVVDNKSDLPSAAGPRPGGLAVSAITGEGIDALLRAIAARLVGDPPLPLAAVPFTAGQIERLQRLACGQGGG